MPPNPPLDLKSKTPSDQIAVPCSRFTFEELATIYNQCRVDYIVPMPMNARRMQEYVHRNDIDLDLSTVAMTDDDEPTGIGMLGLRGQRSWITRLGVIPDCRRRKTGQFITENLIDQARSRGVKRVQLEVIRGNEPARNLFIKLGFQDTRELLVIRRPPGAPAIPSPVNGAIVTLLDQDEIPAHLDQRLYAPSWVEESASLLKAGNLKGFEIVLSGGEAGWVVFQARPFQLEQIVFDVPRDAVEKVTRALLYALHQQYPTQDTKVENVPADHPYWPVFQELGYVEAFRRYEMVLDLR